VTVVIHRSESVALLADELAELLATPLPDPLAREVVAVPSRGLERWLLSRLSLRLGCRDGGSDGIAANIWLPFPGRLVAEVLAVVAPPDPDPWEVERLAWVLVQVLHEHAGDGRLGPAARAGAGRYRRARRIADLFDRYATHRPEVVQAWAAGVDRLGPDGTPFLGTGQEWQLHLWRTVRERIGVPSPAERLPQALERLAAGVRVPSLPERVAVFGAAGLPRAHVELLGALGVATDVHLFTPVASLALATAAARTARRTLSPMARATDPTAALAVHPLLATWGRSGRESLAVLAAGLPHASVTVTPAPPVAATLLGALQRRLRANEAPGVPAEVVVGPDRSVQLHRCHGRARQVEVLREALVHLFRSDPTLQPRDVLVLCPDLDAFAPLVLATFAGSDGSGVPTIPVRVANRRRGPASSALDALRAVVDLSRDRVTATAVLELAASPPIRRVVGLQEEDLATVAGWADDLHLRWGLDGADRAPIPAAHDGGTLRAALDRLLVGVALTNERSLCLDRIAPHDVEGDNVRVAGALADLAERLTRSVRLLRAGAGGTTGSGERPAQEWQRDLAQVADWLVGPGGDDAWQRRSVDLALERLALAGDSPVPLGLDDVRAVLTEEPGVTPRPDPAGGQVTVAELQPLRSVPARVVCVLGLDDDSLRRATPDGDDALATAQQVGDPDPRAELRQSLLDAVLSASDALVLTCTGRDLRTNRRLPDTTLVAELLDALDEAAAVHGHDGPVPARVAVAVDHPRQRFDRRNLVPAGLGAQHPFPWSVDPAALAGAEARQGRSGATQPFLTVPLAPRAPDETVALSTLVEVLTHPVRAFLRQRLELSLPGEVPDERSDLLPLRLDALESWAVTTRLLECAIAGEAHEELEQLLLASGQLPLGALGSHELTKSRSLANALVAAARGRGWDASASRPQALSVALPSGRSLIGEVPDRQGEVVWKVHASKLRAKRLLTACIELLAAHAAGVGVERLEVVHRRRDNRTKHGVDTPCPHVTVLQPVHPATSLEALEVLVSLGDRALEHPLPLFCQTSHDLVGLRGGNHDDGAAETWNRFEGADLHHLLVFGQTDLPPLLDPPPSAGLPSGRALAHELWDTLARAVHLTDVEHDIEGRPVVSGKKSPA
jgi:exodeoxyribonuclease V gamma subunit